MYYSTETIPGLGQGRHDCEDFRNVLNFSIENLTCFWLRLKVALQISPTIMIKKIPQWQSLGHLLREQAEKIGVLTLLRFEGNSMSFAQVEEGTNRLANVLRCSAPHFLDTKKLILNVLSPPICFFVPMVFEFDRRQIT